jgi:hypothetical protein
LPKHWQPSRCFDSFVKNTYISRDRNENCRSGVIQLNELNHFQISLASFAWKFRRAAMVRGLPPAPFRRADKVRWLLISEADQICAAQTYPFFHYSPALRQKYGIGVREVLLKQFLKKPPFRNAVDVVCFQTWFDLKPDQMMRLVDRLHSSYPDARLVYLDWFAPTDLRYAKLLAPHISFYVKKHLMRDRSYYERTTLGDTNLTDYYARRFGLSLGPVANDVPKSFLKKVLLGTSFALSAKMLPLFVRPLNWGERPIDVHARFATNGTPWYSGMRREFHSRTGDLKGPNVVSGEVVSARQYHEELLASKICFSPFGYGEVCWRDFEAAFSGALLFKPDMSHVESSPNIFEAYKTYVPIRWDLSDLEEKTHYYLNHPAERKAITERAFAVVRDHVSENRFVQELQAMFETVANSAALPNDLIAGEKI